MPDGRMACPWFRVREKPFQRLSGSKINVKAHTTLAVLAVAQPLAILAGGSMQGDAVPTSKLNIRHGRRAGCSCRSTGLCA